MPKLTAKELRLSKALVKHKGDRVKAYKAVTKNIHITDSSCNSLVSRALKKNPAIKENIISILDKQGLTDQSLTKSLKNLISAKREFYDQNGNKRIVSDNTTSLNALNTAFKLKSHLSTTPNQSQGQSQSYTDARQINISLTPESILKLQGTIEKLTTMTAQLYGDKGEQTGELQDLVEARGEDMDTIEVESG